MTCDVDSDSGSLRWDIGSSDNRIMFDLEDNSSLTTQTDSTGQFTASLIHYSQVQQYYFLGNLTSELVTQVDPLLTDYPITILCNDGLTEMIPSSTIRIAGGYILARIGRSEVKVYHTNCIITLHSTFRVSLLSLECDVISGVWYISVFTGGAVGETTT